MGGQDGVAGRLGSFANDKDLGSDLLGGFLQDGVGTGTHGQNHIVIPTEGTGSAISQGVVHAIGIELADLGAGPQESLRRTPRGCTMSSKPCA